MSYSYEGESSERRGLFERLRHIRAFYEAGPEDPHVRLPGGEHTDVHLDIGPIFDNEGLLRTAVEMLLRRLVGKGENLENIQAVVGPNPGGEVLGKFLAKHIQYRTEKDCFFASPSVQVSGKTERYFLDAKDRSFIEGKRVLLCINELTNVGQVDLLSETVSSATGNLPQNILALANTSGYVGNGIVSLIPNRVWQSGDCELCDNGSFAFSPTMWPRKFS
jgi:hypothetical protein